MKDPKRDVSRKKVLEQINSLKQDDETLYNILAVDVWALAKTMDEVQSGFWAAFMKNREKARRRLMGEAPPEREPPSPKPPFLH